MATTTSSAAIAGANTELFGAAEREFQSVAPTGSQTLDKMAFLKLLVAQLQNQDPLNPTDNTEFVSQLAQFTSLESLNNINDGVTNLNSSMEQQGSVGAVAYLGKSIQSYGDQVTKLDDGKTTQLYYYVGDDIAGGNVNIVNGNDQIVRTIPLAAKNAGLYTLDWDGLDYAGKNAASGVYKVYISARDASGAAVMASTQVAGKVDGVFYDNGKQYLRLEDGRTVSLKDVTAMVDGTTTADTKK